ncbi:hypothetical protein EVAR_34438_1 [Eumeta japonica]|uniref:Uncharacterized protein n=1 Tax=Eumeta variegata TaxID=151549 RepID=A0A4C1WM42_EUMVA|nr:hypothetical protein EVAR_34438_1 [Eumeta japonica]
MAGWFNELLELKISSKVQLSFLETPSNEDGRVNQKTRFNDFSLIVQHLIRLIYSAKLVKTKIRPEVARRRRARPGQHIAQPQSPLRPPRAHQSNKLNCEAALKCADRLYFIKLVSIISGSFRIVPPEVGAFDKGDKLERYSNSEAIMRICVEFNGMHF